MELLLPDLVVSVLEGAVKPVDYVEHFDCFFEQLVVNLRALDYVDRENVLELHY